MAFTENRTRRHAGQALWNEPEAGVLAASKIFQSQLCVGDTAASDSIRGDAADADAGGASYFFAGISKNFTDNTLGATGDAEPQLYNSGDWFINDDSGNLKPGDIAMFFDNDAVTTAAAATKNKPVGRVIDINCLDTAGLARVRIFES